MYLSNSDYWDKDGVLGSFWSSRNSRVMTSTCQIPQNLYLQSISGNNPVAFYTMFFSGYSRVY